MCKEGTGGSLDRLPAAAVKTGRYVGSPSASRCVGFVTVGRWRIKSTS